MSELSFHTIGSNPKQDAKSMHRLCIDKGVDEIIRKEFESTIKRYSNGKISKLAKRIIEKYSGDYPEITGSLIQYDGKSIGIAYSGVSDVLKPNQDAEPSLMKGVNVSAWIIDGYRGLGIGKSAIAHTTDLTVARVNDTKDLEWYDRTIWTSIDDSNIASQKACGVAGFVRSYEQYELPGRSIYLLDKS